MNTKNQKRKYVEWLSAEELHHESLGWVSALHFAEDEQRFLNNLVKENTLDLVDAKVFKEVKPVIAKIDTLEKKLKTLLKQVQLHENQLQIMVDDVDQLKMESAYLETHMDLSREVLDYFEAYRASKTKIFKIISSVMKKRRQKRLLT